MMQSQQATSTNPFTGEGISQQKFLSQDEMKQRIQTSYTTFMNYRKSDPKSRSERFNRLAEILEKNTERLSKIITLEIGKPLSQSRREVTKSIELIRYYAKNVDQFLKTDDLSVPNIKKSYVIYQPLGPIYQMTSYNFPLFNILRRAIPSLVMGNTVLNRSSENTQQTGMLVEEMFKEAGFVSGEYLNLIIPFDQSEFIISNPLIRGVFYIGSMTEGVRIASLAGGYSKKIVMESGGNDPFIVLKDADINLAVEQALRTRLRHGGQSTMAGKRFFIEESVYQAFRDRLLQRVQEVKIGDPMDENTILGPLASKECLQKAKDQVKRAQDQGAKLLYGGDQPKDPNLQKGFFLMPTVMEVPEGNPILREETFAPIFALTPVRTDQDIIRMSNDSPFGLSASIFTKDQARGESLGYELEVGSVFINSLWDWNPEVPIGGVKGSGVGREGGIYGVREFVNIKSILIS